MDAHQELEIIARVKAGLTNEFEHLVRAYQTPLFRITGSLVDRSMVEDLVQDIFMIAFSRLESFDPRRGSFRTWLYRIARNRALNARKKKRECLMEQIPVIADERTPCHDILTKEAFRCLDQAFNRLKFPDRVLFILAEIEGLSYAEIAQIESLAMGTVKSRLARIRLKLRNALHFYVN